MASREIGKMLDELMGNHRNLNPDDKHERLTWMSRTVCPYFLVDYCPHQLFTNTKADLGACPKIHKDHLRDEFQKVSEENPKKLEYMEDLLKIAQRLCGDLQSKIRRAKERLALTTELQQGSNGLSPLEQEEIEKKVQILTEKVNELVAQAEEAGTQGDIEEAQGLLKLCDQLKEEREEMKSQIGMKKPQGFGGEGRFGEAGRQMEVCEICGAFFDRTKQSKVDDHIMGKLHMGYARLKVTIDRLGEDVTRVRGVQEKKAAEEGGKESVFERNARLARTAGQITEVKAEGEAKEEGRGSREREKSKRRSKSRERKRSSDRRKRSRSSERKRRSKSSERRRRSRSGGRRRSRERKDRSKERRGSRERRREKSRERRRSRSGERRRRSRS